MKWIDSEFENENNVLLKWNENVIDIKLNFDIHTF